MAYYTPPEWIADRIVAGSESAVTLSETLARIDGRVRATIEFEAEKTAALSWCRANGSLHTQKGTQ